MKRFQVSIGHRTTRKLRGRSSGKRYGLLLWRSWGFLRVHGLTDKEARERDGDGQDEFTVGHYWLHVYHFFGYTQASKTTIRYHKRRDTPTKKSALEHGRC